MHSFLNDVRLSLKPHHLFQPEEVCNLSTLEALSAEFSYVAASNIEYQSARVALFGGTLSDLCAAYDHLIKPLNRSQIQSSDFPTSHLSVLLRAIDALVSSFTQSQTLVHRSHKALEEAVGKVSATSPAIRAAFRAFVHPNTAGLLDQYPPVPPPGAATSPSASIHSSYRQPAAPATTARAYLDPYIHPPTVAPTVAALIRAWAAAAAVPRGGARYTPSSEGAALAAAYTLWLPPGAAAVAAAGLLADDDAAARAAAAAALDPRGSTTAWAGRPSRAAYAAHTVPPTADDVAAAAAAAAAISSESIESEMDRIARGATSRAAAAWLADLCDAHADARVDRAATAATRGDMTGSVVSTAAGSAVAAARPRSGRRTDVLRYGLPGTDALMARSSSSSGDDTACTLADGRGGSRPQPAAASARGVGSRGRLVFSRRRQQRAESSLMEGDMLRESRYAGVARLYSRAEGAVGALARRVAALDVVGALLTARAAALAAAPAVDVGAALAATPDALAALDRAIAQADRFAAACVTDEALVRDAMADAVSMNAQKVAAFVDYERRSAAAIQVLSAKVDHMRARIAGAARPDATVSRADADADEPLPTAAELISAQQILTNTKDEFASDQRKHDAAVSVHKGVMQDFARQLAVLECTHRNGTMAAAFLRGIHLVILALHDALVRALHAAEAAVSEWQVSTLHAQADVAAHTFTTLALSVAIRCAVATDAAARYPGLIRRRDALVQLVDHTAASVTRWVGALASAVAHSAYECAALRRRMRSVLAVYVFASSMVRRPCALRVRPSTCEWLGLEWRESRAMVGTDAAVEAATLAITHVPRPGDGDGSVTDEASGAVGAGGAAEGEARAAAAALSTGVAAAAAAVDSVHGGATVPALAAGVAQRYAGASASPDAPRGAVFDHPPPTVAVAADRILAAPQMADAQHGGLAALLDAYPHLDDIARSRPASYATRLTRTEAAAMGAPVMRLIDPVTPFDTVAHLLGTVHSVVSGISGRAASHDDDSSGGARALATTPAEFAVGLWDGRYGPSLWRPAPPSAAAAAAAAVASPVGTALPSAEIDVLGGGPHGGVAPAPPRGGAKAPLPAVAAAIERGRYVVPWEYPADAVLDPTAAGRGGSTAGTATSSAGSVATGSARGVSRAASGAGGGSAVGTETSTHAAADAHGPTAPRHAFLWDEALAPSAAVRDAPTVGRHPLLLPSELLDLPTSAIARIDACVATAAAAGVTPGTASSTAASLPPSLSLSTVDAAQRDGTRLPATYNPGPPTATADSAGADTVPALLRAVFPSPSHPLLAVASDDVAAFVAFAEHPAVPPPPGTTLTPATAAAVATANGPPTATVVTHAATALSAYTAAGAAAVAQDPVAVRVLEHAEPPPDPALIGVPLATVWDPPARSVIADVPGVTSPIPPSAAVGAQVSAAKGPISRAPYYAHVAFGAPSLRALAPVEHGAYASAALPTVATVVARSREHLVPFPLQGPTPAPLPDAMVAVGVAPTTRDALPENATGAAGAPPSSVTPDRVTDPSTLRAPAGTSAYVGATAMLLGRDAASSTSAAAVVADGVALLHTRDVVVSAAAAARAAPNAYDEAVVRVRPFHGESDVATLSYPSAFPPQPRVDLAPIPAVDPAARRVSVAEIGAATSAGLMPTGVVVRVSADGLYVRDPTGPAARADPTAMYDAAACGPQAAAAVVHASFNDAIREGAAGEGGAGSARLSVSHARVSFSLADAGAHPADSRRSSDHPLGSFTGPVAGAGVAGAGPAAAVAAAGDRLDVPPGAGGGAIRSPAPTASGTPAPASTFASPTPTAAERPLACAPVAPLAPSLPHPSLHRGAHSPILPPPQTAAALPAGPAGSVVLVTTAPTAPFVPLVSTTTATAPTVSPAAAAPQPAATAPVAYEAGHPHYASPSRNAPTSVFTARPAAAAADDLRPGSPDAVTGSAAPSAASMTRLPVGSVGPCAVPPAPALVAQPPAAPQAVQPPPPHATTAATAPAAPTVVVATAPEASSATPAPLLPSPSPVPPIALRPTSAPADDATTPSSPASTRGGLASPRRASNVRSANSSLSGPLAALERRQLTVHFKQPVARPQSLAEAGAVDHSAGAVRTPMALTNDGELIPLARDGADGSAHAHGAGTFTAAAAAAAAGQGADGVGAGREDAGLGLLPYVSLGGRSSTTARASLID